ncbi:hypothetical protein EJB05_32877, partial [Eragrostis curvula]
MQVCEKSGGPQGNEEEQKARACAGRLEVNLDRIVFNSECIRGYKYDPTSSCKTLIDQYNHFRRIATTSLDRIFVDIGVHRGSGFVDLDFIRENRLARSGIHRVPNLVLNRVKQISQA